MTDETQQTTAPETMGWNPNPGDVVKGKIVAVGRAWSTWTNSHYPLVTIHDENSGADVDVHAFHATLQARLMETRPSVGDEIEIAYVGKRATKDGKREVSIYRVSVPGADGQAVWDSLESQTFAHSQAAKKGTSPEDEDIPF